MDKLTRNYIFSLEKYSEIRPEFRRIVLGHKKNRQVSIGEHATLYFEDSLTMQYQVQEMLRIEKIFDPDGIQEELDAYNPLIPDGSNWKATFMIEYSDAEERRHALTLLGGIENHVWVRIGSHEPVIAIADEDIERSNYEKTSAVHFLRFELSDQMIDALRLGANVAVGISHKNYNYTVEKLDKKTVQSLVSDLF